MSAWNWQHASAKLGIAMIGTIRTPARVRRLHARDARPPGQGDRESDDPLGPMRGMLIAAGLAAAMWGVIGLIVWWIVG